MKWIKINELDYDNLYDAKIIVILNKKGQYVINEEKLWHYHYKDCDIPSFIMEFVDSGRYLLIDNPDGSHSVWTLSCTHFKNVEAIMYTKDMLDDFLKN